MATTVTFSNQLRRSVPAVRVYTRSSWDAEWTLQEHLFCESCDFVANPEMAKAQFSYLYGRMMQAGSTSWEDVPPLDVARNYVKVEIDDPDDDENVIIWAGILEDEQGNRKGLLTDSSGGRGTQAFTAYGFDVMLHRHVLTKSTVLSADGTEVTVQRAVEFNAKAQVTGTEKTETGNRSNDTGENGTYIFANDLKTADFWTTLNAAQYLLAYNAPPNELDDVIVVWRLDAAAFEGNLPDFDKPRKVCHGRTLRQLLDELIDRRRIIGYTVELDAGLDGDEDQIVLRTFTFADEDVSYEDDVIPANSSQKAVVFDSDTAVSAIMVKKSTLDVYDQVICQGERSVACFTIQGPNGAGTLDQHWNDEQAGVYQTAASETDGYDDLQPSQQDERNKRARKLDNVKRVYSYFGLPTDFDGNLSLTIGDELYDGVVFQNPEDDDGGVLPMYPPQLRFHSHLPLKTDHDYSGELPADVEDNTPDGQRWEYRPMLVAIKLPNSYPVRYHVLNSMAINTEVGDDTEALSLSSGIEWSAAVRAQDDVPGIVLSISGEPQYVIAKDDFTPLDIDDDDESLTEFDWRDLIATVAMPVDKFCEGRWPDAPGPTQVVRRLVIDLGDEYKQHYVAGGTVVEIGVDGTPKVNGDGGFIRDDSDKLTSLARLVYEWYASERQSISLTFAYVTAKLSVGDLITTIGQGDSLETVNTVVTGLRYEFTAQDGSRPGTAKTTISTDFAEIDAKRFVGEQGR